MIFFNQDYLGNLDVLRPSKINIFGGKKGDARGSGLGMDILRSIEHTCDNFRVSLEDGVDICTFVRKSV